jgi:hypothetical protein
MQAKGLIAAAGLLMLLGGLVWWSSKTKKDYETETKPATKLIELPESEVRRVELRRAPGETTILEKDASGEWRLTAPAAYPVDKETLVAFLRAVT